MILTGIIRFVYECFVWVTNTVHVLKSENDTPWLCVSFSVCVCVCGLTVSGVMERVRLDGCRVTPGAAETLRFAISKC